MKIRSWLSAAAIWVTTIPVCAGQGAPRKLCSSDGSGTSPRLAEIAAAQPNTTVAPGDPILVYRAEGDWTCGYYEDRRGAGPVWVRSKDIRPVHFDPSPPLDAWHGTWAGGEGHIRIQKSQAPGRLNLEGEAQWHGLGDVVHLGNFAGEASPNGNHVHFVESGAGSCTVDLTLIGKYLVVDDNSACGGMNVRFSGLWTRTRQH